MMFIFYYILFFTTASSLVLTAFFAYYSRRFFATVVITTLIAIGATVNFHVLNEIKGMPVEKYSDRFTIISYMEDRPDIFLWILSEHRDHPVTIVIPWTEEDAKKLAENKAQIEGQGMEGALNPSTMNYGGILEIFDFDYTAALPKTN
jgi:hypothetical protein